VLFACTWMSRISSLFLGYWGAHLVVPPRGRAATRRAGEASRTRRELSGGSDDAWAKKVVRKERTKAQWQHTRTRSTKLRKRTSVHEKKEAVGGDPSGALVCRRRSPSIGSSAGVRETSRSLPQIAARAWNVHHASGEQRVVAWWGDAVATQRRSMDELDCV
jgi:hypothetical protein